MALRAGAPTGNSNGKRGTEWRDAVRWALSQTGPDKRKKLKSVAIALVDKALSGDVNAIKEIGDRIDGKSMQINEITGAGGGPIQINVTQTDERL